jgi:hypothetical protein
VSTPLLIMLSAVAGWWLFLTVLVVWRYIQRVRDAKAEPLTPEQIEECRRLEGGCRRSTGVVDAITLSPSRSSSRSCCSCCPVMFTVGSLSTEIRMIRTRPKHAGCQYGLESARLTAPVAAIYPCAFGII